MIASGWLVVGGGAPFHSSRSHRGIQDTDGDLGRREETLRR